MNTGKLPREDKHPMLQKREEREVLLRRPERRVLSAALLCQGQTEAFYETSV